VNIEFFGQLFEKYSNKKFQENSFYWKSNFWMRKDRRDGQAYNANSRFFAILRTLLKMLNRWGVLNCIVWVLWGGGRVSHLHSGSTRTLRFCIYQASKLMIWLNAYFLCVLINNQFEAQFFFVFVYFNSLHVSSTMCSSSGDSIVSIRHLVYVT
jgi:hypothetical protein